MRTHVPTILCALLLLFFTTGCSKTGSQGATGATGATGPAGPVGPAGANGTLIYSGTTTPPASLGDSGDYYLDLATDYLYGPKSTSGWGTGIDLKGTSGPAGSQIYSGSTTPASTLGNVGDYYLDIATYVLYGPKTASGWGTGIVLKGATGTANVIYSDWNYASNYRDSTIDGSYEQIATLSAPSLTAADLNTATIEVFFTFGAGDFPLPYTSYAGAKGSTISFIPKNGQIIITRFTFDNSASIPMSSVLQFRFVIIPGGVNVTDALTRQIETH